MISIMSGPQGDGDSGDISRLVRQVQTWDSVFILQREPWQIPPTPTLGSQIVEKWSTWEPNNGGIQFAGSLMTYYLVVLENYTIYIVIMTLTKFDFSKYGENDLVTWGEQHLLFPDMNNLLLLFNPWLLRASALFKSISHNFRTIKWTMNERFLIWGPIHI